MDQSLPVDPPEGEGAERPKSKIIDTRYAPLFHLGEETDGYGLYTYLLLRGRTDRDRTLVKDIRESSPLATDLSPSLRSQIDLLLVPANDCVQLNSKPLSDCTADMIKRMTDNLEAYYNYDEGPFLFTYAKPISKMSRIPPPFLFFDFTSIDEAAFHDYIAAYESVVKSDDYSDDGKLNSLRLRILNVIDQARSVARPTVEAAGILVHIIYEKSDKKGSE